MVIKISHDIYFVYLRAGKSLVRHYGAEVKEIKRSGVSIVENLSRVKFHEGDTLVLWADDSFISTWGDSSVFVLLANGKDTKALISGIMVLK